MTLAALAAAAIAGPAGWAAPRSAGADVLGGAACPTAACAHHPVPSAARPGSGEGRELGWAAHDCGTPGGWRAHLPADAFAAVRRVDLGRLRLDALHLDPPAEDLPADDVPPATPPAEAPPAADPRHTAEIEADIALGRDYAAQVEKELKLSANAEYQARVQRIGEELALVANAHAVTVTWGDPRLSRFPYQFRVVEGKDVNAFSLPGGFIYIYEGLVEYAESDDELAGVVAHEIAHASFRHIATLRREQSRLEAITLPLILISIFAGGQGGANLAQGGLLVNQAMGSGWSVRAEEAADTGGLQYLQLSGYDPVGMLTFMERLAYDDRKRANVDWGIYRTHPPSRERAENLRRGLRDAGVPIARSRVSTTLRTRFDADPASGGVALTFAGTRLATFAGPDAADRARAAAPLLDAFMDGVPKIHEIRSEGAAVWGRGRPLFALTEADAAARGRPLATAVREATQAVKAAAYELNYRVWDAF